MLDLFISTIAFTVTGFSLLVIPKSHSKGPLTLVFVCLLYFSSGTILFALMPALTQLYISLLPAMFFLFLPALWIYHDTLISSRPWGWHKSLTKHFLSIPVMFLLFLALFSLPDKEFHQMFFSSEIVDTFWLKGLSFAFLISVLGWCLLSFGYLFSIAARTSKYRTHIRLVYADESGRSLNWIGLTSTLIIFTWIYGMVVFAVENRLQKYGFSETGVLVLLMMIVLVVALNGLKQKPGFSDVLEVVDAEVLLEKKPYEHSALSENDMHRISAKLSAAITENKVYLEPELNLVKLSKYVAEPSQYISQTLSQHLNTTFFDFINKARINEARQLLTTTDESVLCIAHATGFNSRSSFYRAFRQHMNQTPGQYRSQSA